MTEDLSSIAEAIYWSVPGHVLFLLLHLIGVGCFTYIVTRRMTPLLRAQRDLRFDRPWARLGRVAQFWFGQWRHPRYKTAGILHILIFAGFLILAARAFSLLILGVTDVFAMSGLSGAAGHLYDIAKDYAATVVLLCMVFAVVRRLVFQPERYRVPERFGKGHTPDAIFLLSLIAILMVADGMFASSQAARQAQYGLTPDYLAPFSMPWVLASAMAGMSAATLWNFHVGAYFLHEFAFFFLLCYRPFGIQFHVETSLFSIYFAKLDRGTVKPVRWGVSDEQLDQVKSFGIKKYEDFTWKHMLDFYSCADCGRCADQCPSNAVGRPLVPRFLTLKARDYGYQHYRVFSRVRQSEPLVGTIYSEDEIWSCTTCGACEAECPLLIEYIDKIVDLRRGLVDDGKVPQSLQKPLKALESRGNPYGKLDKKRGDWVKSKEFQQACEVPVLNGKNGADTLYFVDSITSYDDRIQSIGRATAKILRQSGARFGILGPAEKDSGHEVRRFGEELLFLSLRDHNQQAIQNAGVSRIVTADPHAYNALKHDYRDVPPVEHISEWIAREVRSGNLPLTPEEDSSKIFAYHDPCYLGRHNQVFDAPREALDAIPGLKRVEMGRCRDRSFCCGGGGLALFYEPKEEERMGVKRVRMAAEAGANVIVTACPFCMVNIEDAIKVAGMEGKMTAIDLTELVSHHVAQAPACVETN
ncbi:MAG TPA: (Fe-S)-binding protein [Bryobacteraceae bacterium]|nr:(Fe-S)-binding protein [Bryobacteraceae bacterium]